MHAAEVDQAHAWPDASDPRLSHLGNILDLQIRAQAEAQRTVRVQIGHEHHQRVSSLGSSGDSDGGQGVLAWCQLLLHLRLNTMIRLALRSPRSASVLAQQARALTSPSAQFIQARAGILADEIRAMSNREEALAGSVQAHMHAGVEIAPPKPGLEVPLHDTLSEAALREARRNPTPGPCDYYVTGSPL